MFTNSPLERGVIARLEADPRIADSAEIAVADDGSTVTLRGTVKRFSQRRAAEQDALDVFRTILDYSAYLQHQTPKIDYFATSLPAMLLFEEDLARRQTITACFLEAQGRLGLGDEAEGLRLLEQVLALRGAIPERELGQLRKLARRITERLAEQLANRLRPAMSGLSIARPTRRSFAL